MTRRFRTLKAILQYTSSWWSFHSCTDASQRRLKSTFNNPMRAWAESWLWDEKPSWSKSAHYTRLYTRKVVLECGLFGFNKVPWWAYASELRQQTAGWNILNILMHAGLASGRARASIPGRPSVSLSQVCGAVSCLIITLHHHMPSYKAFFFWS